MENRDSDLECLMFLKLIETWGRERHSYVHISFGEFLKFAR